MAKLRSALAFSEDLPGADGGPGGNEYEDGQHCSSWAQQQWLQQERQGLASMHAADAEELCHAVSLLDDDELDRILAGNSGAFDGPGAAGALAPEAVFDLGLDGGFDL